jgi:PTH1 family peptidyl-tRNA hydrolase
LLVVHDDLDLPLGEIRERDGGGHGGHNGLRDVMQKLGTGSFRRLRIGIGRPPSGVDPAEYVLATFRPDEFEAISAALDRAAEIILEFVKEPSLVR